MSHQICEEGFIIILSLHVCNVNLVVCHLQFKMKMKMTFLSWRCVTPSNIQLAVLMRLAFFACQPSLSCQVFSISHIILSSLDLIATSGCTRKQSKSRSDTQWSRIGTCSWVTSLDAYSWALHMFVSYGNFSLCLVVMWLEVGGAWPSTFIPIFASGKIKLLLATLPWPKLLTWMQVICTTSKLM